MEGGEGRREGGKGRGERDGGEGMYSMIMYSGSVKFSGITSPIGPPTLRNITSSNVER